MPQPPLRWWARHSLLAVVVAWPGPGTGRVWDGGCCLLCQDKFIPAGRRYRHLCFHLLPGPAGGSGPPTPGHPLGVLLSSNGGHPPTKGCHRPCHSKIRAQPLRCPGQASVRSTDLERARRMALYPQRAGSTHHSTDHPTSQLIRIPRAMARCGFSKSLAWSKRPSNRQFRAPRSLFRLGREACNERGSSFATRTEAGDAVMGWQAHLPLTGPSR